MSPVLVDTNVPLDVTTNDPAWGEWSSRTLADAADEGVLVINPLIYTEASVSYEQIEDLEAALPAELFRRDHLPYEAAFLAGTCFATYRKHGGRTRADSRLLHRRPCGHRRIPFTHPRYRPLPDLLPDRFHHRPELSDCSNDGHDTSSWPGFLMGGGRIGNIDPRLFACVLICEQN